MRDYTIAAVVVTYNRKELLEKNIEMLLCQKHSPDQIIIVDNHSDDGTEELVRNRFQNEMGKIIYCCLPQNLGGAGGFEKGTRLAYEGGYDFVWLMDDDGRPEDEDTLLHLLEFMEKKRLIGKLFVLNSLVRCDGERLSFGLFGRGELSSDIAEMAEEGGIEKRINPFNGTLVSKELISEIGFPNGDFFIKGDELDYLARAGKAGAYVATVVNSYYYHPELPLTTCRILGKEFLKTNESPWKEFYRMRNMTYMIKRDGRVGECITLYLKYVVKLMLTGKGQRLVYFKMVTRGWIDGMKGKLGATVRP